MDKNHQFKSNKKLNETISSTLCNASKNVEENEIVKFQMDLCCVLVKNLNLFYLNIT